MEANLINPTVQPSWPEFTSSAVNGTYMLAANFNVAGVLVLNPNVIIIFAGGRFTGSGTIQGNNTTFVAPPVQVFDSTIQFSGTWKMEKVFAENFGDTNGSNAAPAINKALRFSNISGCIVQLLSKEYFVTETIFILGGTTLDGTIRGTSYPGDSVVSVYGTKIHMTGNADMIDIRTTGNASSTDIDCYRFVVSNMALYNEGTGKSLIVKSLSNSITPRDGTVSNITIAHNNSAPGYSIYISGASYLRFERISINGGKGIKIADGTDIGIVPPFQEFIWMRQIAIGVKLGETCFEVNSGNNIYLTEIDANDSVVGFLFKTTSSSKGIYTIFMERLSAIRCMKGFAFHAQNQYITRIKVSDSTISVPDTSGAVAMDFDRLSPYNYSVVDCVFDTIFVDGGGLDNHNLIKENNNSATSCHFLNIRNTPILYNTVLDSENELNFVNILKSGVDVSYSNLSIVREIILASLQTFPSPFPGKPIALVSTNQTIPFKVETTNTSGGESKIIVTFASLPTSPLVISYFLTGYYYS